MRAAVAVESRASLQPSALAGAGVAFKRKALPDPEQAPCRAAAGSSKVLTPFTDRAYVEAMVAAKAKATKRSGVAVAGLAVVPRPEVARRAVAPCMAAAGVALEAGLIPQTQRKQEEAAADLAFTMRAAAPTPTRESTPRGTGVTAEAAQSPVPMAETLLAVAAAAVAAPPTARQAAPGEADALL